MVGIPQYEHQTRIAPSKSLLDQRGYYSRSSCFFQCQCRVSYCREPYDVHICDHHLLVTIIFHNINVSWIKLRSYWSAINLSCPTRCYWEANTERGITHHFAVLESVPTRLTLLYRLDDAHRNTGMGGFDLKINCSRTELSKELGVYCVLCVMPPYFWLIPMVSEWSKGSETSATEYSTSLYSRKLFLITFTLVCCPLG